MLQLYLITIYASSWLHSFVFPYISSGCPRSTIIRQFQIAHSVAVSARAERSCKTFRDKYSDKIPGWLLNKCEEMGYISPTYVQEDVLPVH